MTLGVIIEYHKFHRTSRDSARILIGNIEKATICIIYLSSAIMYLRLILIIRLVIYLCFYDTAKSVTNNKTMKSCLKKAMI